MTKLEEIEARKAAMPGDVDWLIERVRDLEDALGIVVDCCEAETSGCRRAQERAERLLGRGDSR